MLLKKWKKISDLGEVSMRMGTALSFLMLLATSFIMESCDDENHQPKPNPIITSVSPSYALPSSTITINGTNFSSTKNTVRFNGIAAFVANASPTQLTVTVPTDASSGKVTVTVDDLSTAFSSTDFEVLKDIPRNGLVAFYPFNGNANDISGNNLNGVLGETTAAPLLDFDHFGNNSFAYSFDGINDFISLGNPALLQLSNKLSISFWLKPIGNGGYAIAKATGVLIGAGGSANFEKGYLIRGGLPNINGTYGSSNVNLYNVSSNITPALWHHVVFVLSDKNLQMFINGVEVVSKTSNYTENILTDGSLGNLTVGALLDSFGTGSYFKGCIDNLAIYNNALTNDDVIKLYSETITKY